MKKIFEKIACFLRKIIDFFYPPFRKYMTIDFFRYGVVGAANMSFDLLLYYIVYNFVLRHQMLELGWVTLSSHIAALIIVFPVTLLTGFLLQKYVTFTASNLRGRVQLLRYLLVVIINLLINYFGLKLFVDLLHFYPTPSRLVITIFTALLSYVLQKKFTFSNKTKQ